MRPKNLCDFLVRAELLQTEDTTYTEPQQCGRPRSKTCPMMIHTNTFKSHTTGVPHNTKTAMSCKSYNVIHMIQCRVCGQQYVDETGQSLNERMNKHRTDVTHKRTEKPVSAHFNLPSHSIHDMEVLIIKQMKTNDPLQHKIHESRWIHDLQTGFPTGMNLRMDSL